MKISLSNENIVSNADLEVLSVSDYKFSINYSLTDLQVVHCSKTASTVGVTTY